MLIAIITTGGIAKIFIMAKVLALDTVDENLRCALTSLSTLDEAILLPSAQRDDLNGCFSNVTFRLEASEESRDPCIFSTEWGYGISGIKCTSSKAQDLVRCPRLRSEALCKLKRVIQSQLADPDLSIGPMLDADANGRDLANSEFSADWISGFSTQHDFVGLFSGHIAIDVNASFPGTGRHELVAYLVCQAGGGNAAATFDARFRQQMRNGKSIENCLSFLGPTALKRVISAGSRNRARILKDAAEAFGLYVPSEPDAMSSSNHRIASTDFDVITNTLSKQPNISSDISYYRYTCGVDLDASAGIATLSNIADGLNIFIGHNGESRPVATNDALNTLPYAPIRLKREKDLISSIISYAETKLSDDVGNDDCQDDNSLVMPSIHFDAAFIEERFWFTTAKITERDFPLYSLEHWGYRDKERWVSTYASELGVDMLNNVKLRPNCLHQPIRSRFPS